MMSFSKVTRTILTSAAIMTLSGMAVSAQSLQFDLERGQLGIVPPREERKLQRERDEDRRGPRVFEQNRVGITCSEGRRIVRESGFRDVRPVQCGGRSFVYAARQRGEPVEVRISARDGRVVSVEPL